MNWSLAVAHDHVGGHEIDGHPEVGRRRLGGRLARRAARLRPACAAAAPGARRARATPASTPSASPAPAAASRRIPMVPSIARGRGERGGVDRVRSALPASMARSQGLAVGSTAPCRRARRRAWSSRRGRWPPGVRASRLSAPRLGPGVGVKVGLQVPVTGAKARRRCPRPRSSAEQVGLGRRPSSGRASARAAIGAASLAGRGRAAAGVTARAAGAGADGCVQVVARSSAGRGAACACAAAPALPPPRASSRPCRGCTASRSRCRGTAPRACASPHRRAPAGRCAAPAQCGTSRAPRRARPAPRQWSRNVFSYPRQSAVSRRCGTRSSAALGGAWPPWPACPWRAGRRRRLRGRLAPASAGLAAGLATGLAAVFAAGLAGLEPALGRRFDGCDRFATGAGGLAADDGACAALTTGVGRRDRAWPPRGGLTAGVGTGLDAAAGRLRRAASATPASPAGRRPAWPRPPRPAAAPAGTAPAAAALLGRRGLGAAATNLPSAAFCAACAPAP